MGAGGFTRPTHVSSTYRSLWVPASPPPSPYEWCGLDTVVLPDSSCSQSRDSVRESQTPSQEGGARSRAAVSPLNVHVDVCPEAGWATVQVWWPSFAWCSGGAPARNTTPRPDTWKSPDHHRGTVWHPVQLHPDLADPSPGGEACLSWLELGEGYLLGKGAGFPLLTQALSPRAVRHREPE